MYCITQEIEPVFDNTYKWSITFKTCISLCFISVTYNVIISYISIKKEDKYSSVQFSCSVMSDSLRPHGLQHARLSCPSPTSGAQTHVHCVGDASQPSHPSSPSSPAFNLSQHQGLFQWLSSSPQVAKVLGVQIQLSPSNEYSGLISFRTDWFDLLALQGILKSLLQHHSSKASILRHSAFFTVQLSHPYMTTGKTIALTRRTFVGKVMSLLFNMLSMLTIVFLPRSKHLLIS